MVELEPVSDTSIFRNDKLFILLSSLKGFRNGLVYGFKLRISHAVVMNFLYGSGDLQARLRLILKLAIIHGKNLALFAVSFKFLRDLWRRIEQKGNTQYSAAVSAAFVGYFVFGESNSVNTQINLYLLSRILLALARIVYRRSPIKLEENTKIFPWFAATVWGIVLWLHEFHHDDLQTGLQSSMDYIYNDSNYFTCWRDFLWVNKLKVDSSVAEAE